MTTTRLKSYRLTEADIAAIARVREGFQVVSDTAAVQLALHRTSFQTGFAKALAALRKALANWDPTDFAGARAKAEAEDALAQLEGTHSG